MATSTGSAKISFLRSERVGLRTGRRSTGWTGANQRLATRVGWAIDRYRKYRVGERRGAEAESRREREKQTNQTNQTNMAVAGVLGIMWLVGAQPRQPKTEVWMIFWPDSNINSAAAWLLLLYCLPA
jgi:hypothetical protein